MEDTKEQGCQIEEVDIQWCDTNSFIQVEDALIAAGTCLKINSNILFLRAFDTSDLLRLKNVVVQAVNHELKKRKKKKSK